MEPSAEHSFVLPEKAVHNPIPRLLYSRKEAATSLNLSLRSIDYLIENRQLAVKTIGRRVLIAAHELERFAGAPTVN